MALLCYAIFIYWYQLEDRFVADVGSSKECGLPIQPTRNPTHEIAKNSNAHLIPRPCWFELISFSTLQFNIIKIIPTMLGTRLIFHVEIAIFSPLVEFF